MRRVPVEALLAALRQAGLPVGVDDHIRVGRLLAADTSWDLTKLRTTLRALLAQDRESGERFDEVYDALFAGGSAAAPGPPSEAPAPPAAPPPRPRTRRLLAAAAAALLAVAALLGVLWATHVPDEDARPGGAASPAGEAPAPDPGPGIERQAEEVPVEPPGLRAVTRIGLAVGALLLAAVTASWFAARRRRPALGGPWRYRTAPADVLPLHSPPAVEETARALATLGRRRPREELDVEASVRRTVARGGLPSLVWTQAPPAPRILVLEDQEPRGAPWRPVVGALLDDLERAGAGLVRYTFAGEPDPIRAVRQPSARPQPLRRQIVEQEPGGPTAAGDLYALAYWLDALGEAVEARATWDRLVREQPDAAQAAAARFRLGESYFAEGRWEEADEQFERCAQAGVERLVAHALHRSGWCRLRRGSWDGALEAFLAVARGRYPGTDRPVDVPPPLREAAVSDLLVVFVQVGAPSKAVLFCREVSPDEHLELAVRLAEVYAESGAFEDSSRVLLEVIREDPSSHRVLAYQRAILTNAERSGVKERVAKESERLVGLHKKLAPAAPPDFLAQEREELERLLRVLATTYHQEWQQTREGAAMQLARRLYGVYVELFPEAEAAHEMRLYYAGLLFEGREYEKAAEQSERVMVMRPDGEHAAEAAYLALLARSRGIDLGAGHEEGRFGADRTPRHLGPDEAAVIALADRFVQVTEQLADPAPGVVELLPAARFAAAKLLYDANRFSEAIPRFEEILRRHEAHREAWDAARLLLSCYHLRQDRPGLVRTARRIAAHAEWNRGELADIVRRVLEAAAAHACERLEEQRRYRAAADCFGRQPVREDTALRAARLLAVTGALPQALDLLADRYNASPLRGADVLWEMCLLHERSAAHGEAAGCYELFGRWHDDDPRAGEGLRRAALLRQALGEPEAAVRDLGLLLRRSGPPELDAVHALRAAIAGSRGRPRIVGRLRALARAARAAGDAERELSVHAVLAAVLGDGTRGDRRAALRLWQEILEQIRGLGSATVSDASRDVAGRAALALLQGRLGETAGRARVTVDRRAADVEAAEAYIADIERFGQPRALAAALAEVGAAYMELAELVEERACSSRSRPAVCDLRRAEVRPHSEALRRHGTALLERGVDVARSAGTGAEVTTVDALRQLAGRVARLPLPVEARPAPGGSGLGSLAPRFLFQD